jgi:hypothetical protein
MRQIEYGSPFGTSKTKKITRTIGLKCKKCPNTAPHRACVLYILNKAELNAHLKATAAAKSLQRDLSRDGAEVTATAVQEDHSEYARESAILPMTHTQMQSTFPSHASAFVAPAPPPLRRRVNPAPRDFRSVRAMPPVHLPDFRFAYALPFSSYGPPIVPPIIPPTVSPTVPPLDQPPFQTMTSCASGSATFTMGRGVFARQPMKRSLSQQQSTDAFPQLSAMSAEANACGIMRRFDSFTSAETMPKSKRTVAGKLREVERSFQALPDAQKEQVVDRVLDGLDQVMSAMFSAVDKPSVPSTPASVSESASSTSSSAETHISASTPPQSFSELPPDPYLFDSDSYTSTMSVRSFGDVQRPF